MLAIGDDEGGVKVFDTKSGAFLWEHARSKRVLSVCFSDDGQRLAAGGYDEKIAVLQYDSGNLLLEVPVGIVKCIAFSHDGNVLACGEKHGTVRVIDSASGEQKWSVDLGGSIKCVCFTPDNVYLVASSTTGAVVLLRAATGESIWETEATNKVRSVSISPNGVALAIGDDNGKVTLLDVWTGEVGDSPLDCGFFIFYVSFLPDGATLAVLEGNYQEKKLFALDTETGARCNVVTGDCEDQRQMNLSCVCLAHDGKCVATGGRDGDCKVAVFATDPLRLENSKLIWEATHKAAINAVSLGSKAGYR